MIVSVRRAWGRLKFIVTFIVLSYALYQLFGYMSAWVEPEKYREPEGRAVKAFSPIAEAADSHSFKERLRFFYWYGE